MEDEPINKNYLIGCDTIENSPSLSCLSFLHLPANKVNIEKTEKYSNILHKMDVALNLIVCVCKFINVNAQSRLIDLTSSMPQNSLRVKSKLIVIFVHGYYI